VHVAQPSATYVHSVRCSERHRSERLLVRLFVLACACVCVCVAACLCFSVHVCLHDCTLLCASCERAWCCELFNAFACATVSTSYAQVCCLRAMRQATHCWFAFSQVFFPCVRTMANKQQHASGRCALQARFVVQHCGKSHSQNGEASSARVVAHCRAAKTKCALLHTSAPMKQRLRQQCLRTLSRIST
jgi:hypothetical protein